MEIGWTEMLKSNEPKWRNSIVVEIFKPHSRYNDAVYIARLMQDKENFLGNVVIKQSELLSNAESYIYRPLNDNTAQIGVKSIRETDNREAC